MENYKVIANRERLQEFIDWLPELENGECFLLTLFARKKYDSTGTITGDKTQLKRVTVTKKTFMTKLLQMECGYGAYTIRDQPVPQESLAVYVTVNPRSYIKAAGQTLIELAKRVIKPYDGYNPHQLALSAIQDSPSRKIYLDVDFDIVGTSAMELFKKVSEYINKEAITLVKTRGGYHVLIETKKIMGYCQGWYQGISSLPGADITKADLLPVPGCVQGGFEPELFLFP